MVVSATSQCLLENVLPGSWQYQDGRGWTADVLCVLSHHFDSCRELSFSPLVDHLLVDLQEVVFHCSVHSSLKGSWIIEGCFLELLHVGCSKCVFQDSRLDDLKSCDDFSTVPFVEMGSESSHIFCCCPL